MATSSGFWLPPLSSVHAVAVAATAVPAMMAMTLRLLVMFCSTFTLRDGRFRVERCADVLEGSRKLVMRGILTGSVRSLNHECISMSSRRGYRFAGAIPPGGVARSRKERISPGDGG